MPVKPKRSATRKPPDLPSELIPITNGPLGGRIEDALLDGFDFAADAIPELDFRYCGIERVSFANRVVHRFRAADSRFVNCDFSNATLRGLEAARVEFIGCRLIGLKAIECRWHDVLVEDCDARYGQLTDGRLTACEFKGSGFQDADFQGANLEGLRTERVNFSRCNLSGAKLKDADLRGADIEGLLVRSEDVRGAIVTPPQAMELARLLGLVIR